VICYCCCCCFIIIIIIKKMIFFKRKTALFLLAVTVPFLFFFFFFFTTIFLCNNISILNSKITSGERVRREGMFYSHCLLSRKGPLGSIWVAAYYFKKLKKAQVTSTDISSSVGKQPSLFILLF